MEIDKSLVQMISRETAWAYRIIPKSEAERALHFYAGKDADLSMLQAELEVVFGKDIAFSTLMEADLEQLLATYYFREEHTQLGITDDFLLKLIVEARNLKSSDIHIESYEQHKRIRFRIDGMMVERYQVAAADYPALINKVKIMASLDIAEKRLPQDGRIHYKDQQQAFDMRISVLPTLHGEKIVLRLLNNNAGNIALERLGLSKTDLDNYLNNIKKPNGIILISGPTGSGKTTTLYATLKLLNKATRNILTIEDPIEYTLDGINQVQLKERIGLTFASAMRTFLRQDPDVIMVGEIRDPDTANMAIRAALTGHLVLSTIHTNSAWGTVSRLIDMGIPSFLIANTLNTTVAQRLVRMLCPACKVASDFDIRHYPLNFFAPTTVLRHFTAAGCKACYFTGYKGRKAVYEVIPMDAGLAHEVKNGNADIAALLQQRGIQTISENAFNLFASGETTLEEVFPLLTATQ